MNKFILLISFLSLLCFSCKDTSSTSSGAEDRVLITEGGGNQIHVAPASLTPENKAIVDNLRSHAHALIDNRAISEDAYSMIVVGFWVYDGVFAGGERPSAAPPGHWIKFEDDFSYRYGEFAKTQGSGRYHLTFNTEDDPKLIMVDDNPNKTPEEWKIKTKEDVVIFIGSDYFGNNARQMRAYKQMQQPT